MNHYAQALAELQEQPDHELKQIGDQWQTPKAFAWGLFHYFAPTLGPVVLDMFADNCNALLPNYYDAEDNALTQELAVDLRRLGGAAFGNQPYSRPCLDGDGNPITGMDHILAFCRAQREQGAKIMLLIKAATSETWWPDDADFIQFISGRIGFEAPNWYNPRDPKKDKPSSSGFASAVVIFDANWQGERRPVARLRRDDLITTGQIILDMIHRQAIALNEEASHAIEAARHADNPAEDSGHVDDIHVVELTEQPAIANPAAWEQPVASDDATNAACAEELTALEQASAPAIVHHPDYADPAHYLARCIPNDAVVNLPGFDQIHQYLAGWLKEGESPSEICYRITLAIDNLAAGKPIHDGFILEGRTPTLPNWQRHRAVKAIIYQIDDADILTPAKTAELAAWIIDNLISPNVLEQATAKAAELLAQSAEQPTAEVLAEQQLDMLDEPADDADKPLADWAFDYQNDQLSLGGCEWPTFVAVLTVLYGVRETYSPREVAIAISVSDEQLMDEYTTLDEETKVLLRNAVSTLRKVEGYNFIESVTVLDSHRQEAVISLLKALHDEPGLTPVEQRCLMINAIMRVHEVTA